MAETHQFTCISCAVAFNDPSMQRTHFSSDWHRYNMKRRVASLPPLSATTFNAKVIEKREQNAVRIDPRGMHCEACKKQFATENAYRTHVASKKHRLVEARWAEQQRIQAKTGIVAPHQEDVDEESTSDEDEADEEKVEKAVTKIFEEEEVEEDMSKATPAAPKSVEEIKKEEPTASNPAPAPSQSASEPTKLSHLISEDTPEDEISLTLEQKLLASRALHPTNCLFCTVKSKSIESNLDHMFKAHSFYVPERTFLADVPGFLLYLGEKLAVGNVCLFCEGEFGTLQAVRGHMKDKAHQKIRYETDLDRAEFAEYYDFSTSYPDAEERRVKDMERNQRREARRIRRKEKEERRRKREEELEGDGGWEEVEGDDEKMQGVSDGEEEEEVVVVHESESESEVEDDTDESDFEGDDHGLSLAADGLSLRLPSGRTLGHKSLNIYYKQHLRPDDSSLPDSTSTALTTKLRSVRAKLADPSLSLVPVGGGSGAFGKGQMVMKARNAGEAKWAKKLGSTHLDQRMKEGPRHLVSMRGGNNQKHYRDMLLQ